MRGTSGLTCKLVTEGFDMRLLSGLAVLAVCGAALGGTVEYSIDDGDGDTNQGPPSTFDPDTLWGNYFVAVPGGERITSISVAYGPTFPTGGPVTVWLFDDPDDDFDPLNAVPVASATFAYDGTSGDVFVSYPIEPTVVSGGFFVAANAFLFGGVDRPLRVDTGHPGICRGSSTTRKIDDVVDDLSTAAFSTRMDDTDFVIFPGAFMIRAQGEAATHPADFNGDGVVDSADLALLLSAWGTAGADLNNDGVTDSGDLAILLSAWG